MNRDHRELQDVIAGLIIIVLLVLFGIVSMKSDMARDVCVGRGYDSGKFTIYGTYCIEYYYQGDMGLVDITEEGRE